MLLPSEEVKVKVSRIGMCDGNIVVKIEMVNDCSENVLEGSAEVAQATTEYIFTGQHSQEAGVGMDLYNSSPAAHVVWDGHLLAVCGFSIIEIFKDNPNSMRHLQKYVCITNSPLYLQL